MNKVLRVLFPKSQTVPDFPPLAPNITRICVAGFPISPPTAHAHLLANKIAQKHPEEFETWYYWSFSGYFRFLKKKFGPVSFTQIGCPHLKGHETAPFVWIEREGKSADKAGKKQLECIGGDDKFIEFVNEHFKDDKEIVQFANTELSLMQMFHSKKEPATCGVKK